MEFLGKTPNSAKFKLIDEVFTNFNLKLNELKDEYEKLVKESARSVEEINSEWKVIKQESEGEIRNSIKSLEGLNGKTGQEIALEYKETVAEIAKINPIKSETKKLEEELEEIISERRTLIEKLKKTQDHSYDSLRKAVRKINKGKLRGKVQIEIHAAKNRDELIEILSDIEIFQLRANGYGYKAITNVLNSEGKKSKKNNSFSINAVKTILENKTYIGQLNWGTHREWEKKRRSGKTDPISAEGVHEAIIDLGLWNRVKEVNKVNRDASTNTKNIKSEFILSGILRCPTYGAGTVMSKSKKRDGSGYHFYYMCQNYHTKGKDVCRSNLVKKELIEEQVLSYINGLISKSGIVNDIIDKINKEKHTDTDKLQEQIVAYKKELRVKEKELDAIDEEYRNKEITAKAYGRLSGKIEDEVDRLQGIVSDLEEKYGKVTSSYSIDEKIVKEALENFNALFTGASNENKKILIKSLNKKIEVESNRKEIKRIVFWFLEDSALSLKNALPNNEGRRTVP